MAADRPLSRGTCDGVTGVPGQPAIYYMGTAGGGAWKTTDGGMVWKPIFDKQHVASIGAMAVAPSNPNIVYLGTGDVSNVGGAVNQGNGMWKSTDGGETLAAHWPGRLAAHRRDLGGSEECRYRLRRRAWTHLRDRMKSAASSRRPTAARPGARSSTRTTATGAIDVAFAPDNPQIGFAALWYHYVKPDNPSPAARRHGRRRHLQDHRRRRNLDAGHGSAAGRSAHLGRIGVVVAPGGQRVYAIISERKEGGLYRSDDGGAPGSASPKTRACRATATSAGCSSIRSNPDIVYVAQTSLYRSTDGGMTFDPYKGAPGGDDNHAAVDRSHQLRLHDHGQRPGRHRQHGWRQVVDLLVQPADRADLSRLHRQSLSLLGLRHAAGQRLGGDAEPRRLWRNHVSRLGPDRRLRVRLHRSRPAIPTSFMRAARRAGCGASIAPIAR